MCYVTTDANKFTYVPALSNVFIMLSESYTVHGYEELQVVVSSQDHQ
jgi:hypothetical protein